MSTRKTILSVLIGCLLLVLIVLFNSTRKQQVLQEQSESTIDSLRQNATGIADQYERLSAITDSLKKQIALLSAQVLALDTIKTHYREESLKEIEKLSLEKRQLQKEIDYINSDTSDCSGEREKLTQRIDELKKQLELLQARHDIPILFILYSSLKYYYADSSEREKIITEFDRVSSVNKWQETCGTIYSKVDLSSKSQYRSVKWAGQKAGCPFAASYLLVKEYGFDPETIAKDEYLILVKKTLNSYLRDFRHCSTQVKTLFISEEGTLQRIKDTITCLKQNLEI